jgi:hypothetical protein
MKNCEHQGSFPQIFAREWTRKNANDLPDIAIQPGGTPDSTGRKLFTVRGHARFLSARL